MRIAILHPSLVWRGGAERQMLNLASELQNAGHEVEIFTCAVNQRCYPEQLNKLSINVISPPNFPGSQVEGSQKRTVTTRLAGRFRNYTYDLPSMLKLASKIPKGFDVINNHNFPTEWAAYFAKRRLNAPIVWMCNEPPFWFSNPTQRTGWGKINLPLFNGLDRTAVNYIDSIVVLSAIAGKRVEQAYGKPSVIVHTGAKTDQLEKTSGDKIRRKYGLENAFVLLQVGNMARDKRQQDALITLHSLSKKYSEVKLVFDGEGSREELVMLSRKLGVEDKVLFLHSCSDVELAEVYAASDVFVFPAHITWGLAVVEAMAASKPVVVSSCSGVSEIIKDGQNGLILEQPNAEGLTKQVERLIGNPELRQKIAQNAVQYVKENLSWKIYARNMEAVFEKAVKKYYA